MDQVYEMIPFNKPFITGKEIEYIAASIRNQNLSGNGFFTKKVHKFFQEQFHFSKVLMTTSCTDALEMAAILCDINPGDEVILPAFTFVSTANAFLLRGAKLIFVDSRFDHPGIDESLIEQYITKRTKLIVPVHYAGVACDMDKINTLALKHNIFVVEDAAQAINSYYKNQDGLKVPLGSLGDISAFSFHETKNINCGEGGLLVVNNQKFTTRSEIIWEKGTNRSAFFRGEIDKYGWVDIGSSFLPSELNAAFLMAQLDSMNLIQEKRKAIWDMYYEGFRFTLPKKGIRLPFIPDFAENNGHMFYIVCESLDQRTRLIDFMKKKNIMGVFHYQSLNRSELMRGEFESLINSDLYSNCLLRIPLYAGLTQFEVEYIIETINNFE